MRARTRPPLPGFTRCYLHLGSGQVVIFTPRGRIHWFHRPTSSASPFTDDAGTKQLVARFFVGLSIGDEKAWSIEDVRSIIIRVRGKQGRLPNSTIRAQSGTWASEIGAKVIKEDSVEVVIMNERGDTRAKFIRDMRALGERLRIELRQEVVILKVEDGPIGILSTRCHA